ncbi:MAG: alpha/beta hydrolase [Planctomycetaceae bacterium]|nr:alpha/beta hydrolase [Planctomycetaceae bacterium]
MPPNRMSHRFRFSTSACLLGCLFAMLPPLTNGGEWEPRKRSCGDPVSERCLFPWGADFTTPEEQGLKAETVTFKNSFGTKLRGWYFTAEESKQTILFCMGNTGNISLMLPYARILQDGGFDVLLFDYSGFGSSEGIASVTTLLEDTSAAFDFLQTAKSRPAEQIGIFGVSLGTLSALTVAADKQPGVVILEDVFSPAQQLKTWLPNRQHLPKIQQLALSSMENLILPAVDPQRNISRLRCPVFLMHGIEDWLLTPSASMDVAENAVGPVRVWLIPETGHAPHSLETHDLEYADQITGFLREAFDHRVQTYPITIQTVFDSSTSGYGITALWPHDQVNELSVRSKQIVPLEIVLTDRRGRYLVERRLLRPGDSFRTKADFAPTEAHAVRVHHFDVPSASTRDGEHGEPESGSPWNPKCSEFSTCLRNLDACWRELIVNPYSANMFRKDRGQLFYHQAWQQRLPVIRQTELEALLMKIQQLESIPDILRPRYACLLARLHCWPESRCETPIGERGFACAELMLKFCPLDGHKQYELGNANIKLGFADSVVADVLFQLARERLKDGRIEEARALLQQHVKVLPNGVATNLTEERIQAIRNPDDLGSPSQVRIRSGRIP